MHTTIYRNGSVRLAKNEGPTRYVERVTRLIHFLIFDAPSQVDDVPIHELKTFYRSSYLIKYFKAKLKQLKMVLKNSSCHGFRFLFKGRKQRVKIHGVTSDNIILPMSSGVSLERHLLHCFFYSS